MSMGTVCALGMLGKISTYEISELQKQPMGENNRALLCYGDHALYNLMGPQSSGPNSKSKQHDCLDHHITLMLCLNSGVACFCCWGPAVSGTHQLIRASLPSCEKGYH